MSNSVTVKICGEEFKLITDDSIEYTQSVGNHVNAEMQKMLAKRVGRMDAAIMAAVNITDELFKVRETDEQLRAQIKSALDAEATAKSDANAYKRENLSLQKKLEKAEKALAKAEKSLQKIQKTAKSGRSGADDADMDEPPAPLNEAEMAELVEKSKRPRKARKAKAEAVKAETPEETAADAEPVGTEAAPEVAEASAAVEVVVETAPEVPEASAAPETPVAEVPEAVAQELSAPDKKPEAVEET